MTQSLLLAACLTLVGTAILYNLAVLIAALRFHQSAIRNPKSAITFAPPVSVFKPVCGAADHLYSSLACFCLQDYPEYEVLFCLPQGDDPAGAVVRKLQQDFPKLPIRLLVADRFYGTNRKVDSLDKMHREMRHDYMVISDDDITVGPDYLGSVMAEFQDPQVGLVTCPYRGKPGGTLASVFEAVGITGEFFCGVLMARLLEGIRFAMGATMATHKKMLEAIGGFPAIADYHGDDYELGRRVAEMGHRCVLSHYVVDTLLPADTWRSMLLHQFRWVRVQASARPKGHFGLILTYGSIFAVAALAVAPANYLPLVWSMAAVWLAFRLAAAWTVGVGLLSDSTLRRNWFLIPFRELLTAAIWAASLFFKKITWKGEKYISAGGKLIRI